MRVDEMYATFPVAMITGPGYAYGLLFNSTFRSTFDIGAADIERFVLQTDGPELDYYVVFGPTPPQVTAGWRTLLGAMPLPPRWALGYHQSRWSYEREEQVRELAAYRTPNGRWNTNSCSMPQHPWREFRQAARRAAR